MILLPNANSAAPNFPHPGNRKPPGSEHSLHLPPRPSKVGNGAADPTVETEGEESRWVDIDPVDGALVVNIGDMISRCGGGKWKATGHRVVNEGVGLLREE